MIAQDPDKYASTFRKSDKGLSPDELAKKEKQREKSKEQFNNQIQQLEDQFSTIQSQIDELLSLIHISEPTRQAEISYAVFCLKK